MGLPCGRGVGRAGLFRQPGDRGVHGVHVAGARVQQVSRVLDSTRVSRIPLPHPPLEFKSNGRLNERVNVRAQFGGSRVGRVLRRACEIFTIQRSVGPD